MITRAGGPAPPRADRPRSRVLFLVGTRPDAIKMAPLVKAARAVPGEIEPCVVVTGQHRDMLDPVLALFEIAPDHDLRIMQPDQDLFGVTCRSLEGLKPVLERVSPDIVLVQGDTTTAFAGALAASYARVPVGHVEAGLRTRDRDQPFPEEINRHIVSVLATVHFAPTARARDNLLAEGVPSSSILVTGNTVIDALLDVAARPCPPFPHDLAPVDFSRRVVLVTAHRRESFGQPFDEAFHAIADLSRDLPDVEFVYPVHKNPHVQRQAHEVLAGLPRVHLVEPLSYEVFVHAMRRSHLILTDSGGIQEEAPSLGKPVLVMRDKTERPEGIEAGAVLLVGTRRASIIEGVQSLLEDPGEYSRMSQATNPYGDGRAASRIIACILGRPETVPAFG